MYVLMVKPAASSLGLKFQDQVAGTVLVQYLWKYYSHHCTSFCYYNPTVPLGLLHVEKQVCAPQQPYVRRPWGRLLWLAASHFLSLHQPRRRDRCVLFCQRRSRPDVFFFYIRTNSHKNLRGFVQFTELSVSSLENLTSRLVTVVQTDEERNLT